jgi:hypothetical protein
LRNSSNPAGFGSLARHVQTDSGIRLAESTLLECDMAENLKSGREQGSEHLSRRGAFFLIAGLLVAAHVSGGAQQTQTSADAAQQAQSPASTPATRPEQNKSPHERSDIFVPQRAAPSSPVFQQQPKEGKFSSRSLAASLIDCVIVEKGKASYACYEPSQDAWPRALSQRQNGFVAGSRTPPVPMISVSMWIHY